MTSDKTNPGNHDLFNNDSGSLLSDEQKEAVNSADLNINNLNIQRLLNPDLVNQITIEELLLVLKIANATYRAGHPVMDDQVYDHVFLNELKKRNPDHEYLSSVEPEPLQSGKTISLPQKMLSTDKAYSVNEIEKWVNRLIKTAEQLGIALAQIEIRVTPKLDGYAAFDDGKLLYTRGDGVRGQDITRAFERGLKVAGDGKRGHGAGEIVINKSYFESYLSEQFENSRNIQAAIIAEKNVEESVQKAIDDGACVFYPFSQLQSWHGHYQELLGNFDEICQSIWNAVDYDVDGIILETTVEAIKSEMGSTRHHHRWQIAYKINDESAEVKVLSVTPQTSRTGRISPVAELQPTKLSGATISRATVHHYNMVKEKGIGAGAIVELVRSGLVIPKIERVVQSVEPVFPEECPSCESHLLWEGDHLICPNKTDCPAQTENTLIHFFQTLGNVDGFGPKVIEKIHQNGIKKIHEIYQLQQVDFVRFGFGDKTSQNLVDQLDASRNIAVEDWRFLAAFGITRLGQGNCEKLLEHHDIDKVIYISVDEMINIDGFAQLSAEAIFEGMANIREEFELVYQLGFNLIKTEKAGEKDLSNSPLFGKQVVFTGTMVQGSRGDMEKQAKTLGAKVAKSVTSHTTFLVTGEKVGATKINAAKEKGVQVISEAEYLDLIG